jgi:hypothetical protein
MLYNKVIFIINLNKEGVMRKLLALGLVVLLSLGLAGCDLIPTDIIDQVTEYNGVAEDLIDEKIQMFIKDLEDPEKSNEDICSIWYDGIDDDCNRFMEENRTKFKAGAELSKTVNISDPDSDDDGLLDATISFDYNGHVTVLKISFDLNSSLENLQLKINNSELIFTPNRETVAKLDAFIEDLMNSELSNSEVCSIWYDGVDDDCDGPIELARTKFKAGAELSKTINILDPDSDGDGLGDLVVSLNDDGHVTVLKISFTEDFSTEELNLVITDIELVSDDTGGDCDDTNCTVHPGDALMYYQSYLDEYMDASVSEDMLKTYFDPVPSEEYFNLRDRYLSAGTNIVLIDVIGPVEEGTFIFIYDLINGDEASRHHEKVRLTKSIDKASPYLALIHDDDDDGDGISTAEEIDLLASFKDDLNDESIAIEDVCVKYFGQEDDTCRLLRDTEEGYVIGEIELLEFDNTNYIRIRKRPGRTTYSNVEINSTYMVFFYHNEAGSVVFDLVPTEYFDYEKELTNEFDQLFANLDDTTIPLDEVCLAVSTESYSKCDMLRKTVAGNDPSISTTEIMTVDGINMYKITLQYSSQDEVMEMMFYVSFVRDPESMRQVLEIIEVE